jgi:hypothetical protein
MVLRSLDLFTGIGGFTAALRGIARPVAMCDMDPDAQAVLKGRMEDGLLPTCPIFRDVRSLRAKDLSGPVDLIAGGFPCQDVSSIGKRGGLTGARSGLIREVLRLADETRAPLVFLENVSALVNKGLDWVVGELSRRGFWVSWCVLSAGAVGAPHVRRRVFILACKPSWKRRVVVPRAEPLVSWAPSKAPVRMVSDSTAENRIKRVMLLGNSVVPEAVRAAFLVLSTGFASTPAGASDVRSVAFRCPPESALSLSPGAMPSWGHVAPGESPMRVVSVPKMKSPSLKLVFDPKAYRGRKTQHPASESPVLKAPVKATSWSTPRSVTNAGNVLTERMMRDLPTQVRFEAGTPDGLRGGQVSAAFVEWLMGYPRGWTKLPAGHKAVMPTGYRPNLKKRPEHERGS